jgi:hypothetical protein
MIGRNRGHWTPNAEVTFPDIFTYHRRKRVLQQLAFVAFAAFIAEAGMPAAASAVPIEGQNYTIDFDLVKVMARDGPNGSKILSASALGAGPFETENGAGPIDFDSIDTQGNETNLNGITTGQIVANYLSPRYFGSDAAPNGSILLNITNFKFTSGSSFIQIPGVSIGGFQVWVAQPTVDNITAADGGNAFSSTSISSDQKTVLFAGGDIPNMLYPAAGGTGEFLWSAITPETPQPPTSDVYFTTPTIPPDPSGEFASLRLIGVAVAVPEPPSILVLLAGLLGVVFALSRRRPLYGDVSALPAYTHIWVHGVK